MEQTMTTTMQTRHDAIQSTLAAIRAIAPRPQVTRDQLDALKAPLIALASRTDLFPLDSFSLPAGKPGMIYELAVDPDQRYALYASAGAPGKAQPPHNHTTWAVISGVYGDEHNVMYERTGATSIDKRWALTCRKGNAVAFDGDDFHTIEVKSDHATLHLHLYGLALDQLTERVFFGSSAGGEATRFMATPEFFAPYVSAADVRAMLGDGAELALIDVREGGVFAKAHLLTATNIPLSVLELRAPQLLPRRDVRMVLVDDSAPHARGLAQRAARKLHGFGYHNLAVMQGGVAAWSVAGHEVFSGTMVPSKAFGEFIEHANDTPRIEAATLKQWQDEGRDMVVLDSRPMDEYRMMSIPGAIDCPGAELVYRVPQLVKSDATTIVVNCAGRTRSIIGAQSLRNAGFRNEIVALKDGTMGWRLGGLAVAKGADNLAPSPEGEALARAQALAVDTAKKYGVEFIDEDRLDEFKLDRARTTYIFDVRLPGDFKAGHRDDCVNAPGGQLVQGTDTYAAVRGARIVLCDRDCVQAVMTAHWLRQMDWREVYVLRDALAGSLTTGGAAMQALGAEALSAAGLTPRELDGAIKAGQVEVIDVDASLKYRAGRIPGAWYALRSRLAECLQRFETARPALVFTSSNGVLARYAAQDAIALGHKARYLEGGTAAWNHDGFKTEPCSGDDDPKFLTATEDVWYRPYDRNSGVEEAMRQYLTWEVNLLEQLKRETYLRFTTQPV